MAPMALWGFSASAPRGMVGASQRKGYHVMIRELSHRLLELYILIFEFRIDALH